MSKINLKSLMKWAPVILTTIVAGVSAFAEGIGDQKREDRMDSMEERLAKLEDGES